MLGDGWLDGEHPEFNSSKVIASGLMKGCLDRTISTPNNDPIGVRFVGIFPISVWQRPINLGFKITSYDQNI